MNIKNVALGSRHLTNLADRTLSAREGDPRARNTQAGQRFTSTRDRAPTEM